MSPGMATHSHWMAAESPSWQSSAAAAVGRPMAGDGAGAARRRRPLLSPRAARSFPPPPRGGAQGRFRCHSQRVRAEAGGWRAGYSCC